MLNAADWLGENLNIFVGGEWVPVKAGRQIESVCPADEKVIGSFPAAEADDVDAAVEAIRSAVAPWGALPIGERARYLRQYAQVLRENEVELAKLETLDGGLPHRAALANIRGAAEMLGYYCGLAMEIKGATYPSPENLLQFTLRQPYGIVARIVPFNHPIQFAVMAAGPALITGNVVILKPAEQTSLSTLALAELASTVFPPGVFNVITGYGREAGLALVSHPEIPRIGFTGSVPTGRAILEAASPYIKHVTLELGGKNPLVVGAGVDVDTAADAARRGMNLDQVGQSCQSNTRLLVHTSLYDDVVEATRLRLDALTVGDPSDEDTDIGPLAFEAHFKRVMDYIRIGCDEGATLVTGGSRPEGMDSGYYVRPTLFADVKPHMRIATEEIFGPVLSAIPWSDTDELLEIVNGVEFGLTSRVLTTTLDEGMRLAQRIEAGTVLVNTKEGRPRGMPFGGQKQSGLGRQNCLEEIISYTQDKSIVAGF